MSTTAPTPEPSPRAEWDARRFVADATPLTRAQARGHLMRFGHDLEGYWSPAGDERFPEAVQLVRTCGPHS